MVDVMLVAGAQVGGVYSCVQLCWMQSTHSLEAPGGFCCEIPPQSTLVGMSLVSRCSAAGCI
jgi:hypothetical protein